MNTIASNICKIQWLSKTVAIPLCCGVKAEIFAQIAQGELGEYILNLRVSDDEYFHLQLRLSGAMACMGAGRTELDLDEMVVDQIVTA